MRLVTIKEIAEELGLHYTTVSRALKGNKLIKNETRELVVKKAHEMGYSPNLLAQGFRNGRSRTVAVLVPDLKHHYFSKFVSDMTDCAYANGYMTLIFQSNDNPALEKKIISSLIGMRVGGVAISIGLNTQSVDHFKVLKERNIPTVFFDRIPSDTPFSTVSMDNISAVRRMVRELIVRGKRRIAYISFDSLLKVFADRLRGYEEAIEQSGLFYKKVIHTRQFFIHDGYEIAESLVRQQQNVPDAVICVNDEVAIGVMQYLHEHDYCIPGDIAVTGFDDNPIGSVSFPRLTTVAQPIKRSAEVCFNLLLEQIKAEMVVKTDILLSMDLKIRESL